METKIRSLLAIGEKPKDIASKLDVGYPKVLKIRKDMDAEKTNASIDDVVMLDPVALELIVDKAKENAPAKVVKKLESMHEGISGLQKLDNEFHTTFSKILTKAEEFLNGDDLTPAQWVSITNALSNAYNNIFNSSGVNVHVDNSTKVSNSSVAMMKGAMRG